MGLNKKSIYLYLLILIPIFFKFGVLYLINKYDQFSPIIFLEYFILLLCLSYIKESKSLKFFIYILFLLYFSFDYLRFFSIVYYFNNSFKFIENIVYLPNILDFPHIYIFIFTVFVIGLVLTLFLIIKVGISNRRLTFKSTLILLFISLILEFINDCNATGYRNLFSYNILGLESQIILNDFISNNSKNSTKLNYKKNELNPFSKIKENSSSKKILIVIVESWGMYKNNKLNSYLFDNFRVKGYTVSFGQTSFFGTTTTAEINLFTNTNENFRNYFDKISDSSIFDIMKQKGYKTYGYHSYDGNMFGRNIWWKNIGIDSLYFLENFNKLKFSKNNENPFVGVEDNDVLSFIFDKNRIKDSTIHYFLTLNTHFPFYSKKIDIIKKSKQGDLPTKMLNEHFFSIDLFLKALVTHINKKDFDFILIKGDHNPPVTSSNEKAEFIEKTIPIVILKMN